MKKHLLLLIKLLLISIATCSIGIVVSIWLIAREPIPSEVYVKYGIIGAVVGLWGGAGIWLQLYLQMRRYYRKQLLLRITRWRVIRPGNRSNKVLNGGKHRSGISWETEPHRLLPTVLLMSSLTPVIRQQAQPIMWVMRQWRSPHVQPAKAIVIKH